MQGIVFTVFADMIIDQLGMPVWNQLLTKVAPASGGAYTVGAAYDDQELMGLVVELSAMSQVSVPDLVRQFGRHLFPTLVKNSPVDIHQCKNLKEFLFSLNDLVHREVKRLNPTADLPHFDFDEKDDQHIRLIYRSKRKLCFLCEGLIEEAAKEFNQQAEISQSRCMHEGDSECYIDIKISPLSNLH